MRRNLAPLAFTALTAASPPAAAEAPTAGKAAGEVVPQQEAQPDVPLPAELEKQLTPAPTWKYGRIWGPCNFELECPDGTVIGCSGQNDCDWKYPSATAPGYLQCDQQPFVYCPLA